MPDLFAKFAHRVSAWTGSAYVFAAATLVILVWGISGPLFGFSNTWQLVINTGTTIVTFLMVFLIQNTQNRDAAAMHLKLDELIRAVQGARNQLIDVEEDTEANVHLAQDSFRELAAQAHGANGAVENDPQKKAESP